MAYGPVQSDQKNTSTDPALILAFLAKTDAVCMRCGYNLRGCAQTFCPECGDELRISIGGQRSTASLHKALRSVAIAVLIQSALSALWTFWTMFRFGLPTTTAGPGNTRLASAMDPIWLVRWGIQGAIYSAIAVIAAMLLVRLGRVLRGQAKYESIPPLCMTLGWLVAINMLTVVGLGFFT